MSDLAAPGAVAAPRTARRRRTRWIVAVIATIVVVAGGLFVWPLIMRAANPAPPTMASTPVVASELVVTTSADGAVEPADTEEVFATVGGTVDSVAVAVGDRVKQGEKLFAIDRSELQSAVRSAKARLRQADQQVWSAKQQIEQAEYQVLQAENRLDTLESRPATRAATGAEIDEAEKGIDVAEAGLTAAKKNLLSAKATYDNASRDYSDAVADLDDATVVAPIDGVVTAVNVVEGGSVSGGSASSAAGATSGASAGASAAGASSAHVVIADTSELIVTVAVNEVDIADVQVGQEATITLDALQDLEIAARVAWVSPNAVSDGSISTYEVELELDEQDERMRSGMTATADIVTVTVADALLVPKASVKVDGATKYVTVLSATGTAERRTVTTGPSDDTNVQIVTGITAGERVVTSTSSSEEESPNGFMPPSPGGLEGGRPAGGGGMPPMGGN